MIQESSQNLHAELLSLQAACGFYMRSLQTHGANTDCIGIQLTNCSTALAPQTTLFDLDSSLKCMQPVAVPFCDGCQASITFSL